jgi:phosphomannomutase
MQCPKVAIFDLDNTLAEPFTPVSDDMAAAFSKVMGRLPTSIMSAASLERIELEVLSKLSGDVDMTNLTLFTANAGQSFAFEKNHWRSEYSFEFTDAQLKRIRTGLEESLAETNVLEGTQIYGEQYIDYKGYFAFTALGVGAPVAERRAWDPEFSKRKILRARVQEKLPEFDVYIGGSTSIDITLKDVNKSYGIKWLSERLGIPPSDMLYVGDALYENGNDYVVIKTGIQTRQTKNPEETLSIANELLAACSA